MPDRMSLISRVAGRELVATLRSGLTPLARIRPLPAVQPREGRVPVVLVHGFMGHADLWRPLTRTLYKAGWPEVTRISYPSFRFTLDEIAGRIDKAIRPLAAKGEVDLVGHSLGAVACRAYLKLFGGQDLVRRFVSLGGPHKGTRWFRFTPRALQPVLDPQGPWVHRLNRGEEPVPTTVIRSRYDHQVFPPENAEIPGMHEVIITGYGHNGLLWAPEAHAAIIEALT